MEQMKIWSALMSLFTVVSVCLGWMYLDRVDRANASFLDARLQLEQTRSHFSEKKQRIDSRLAEQPLNEAANAMLKEATASAAAVDAMNTEAGLKEVSVRAGIQSALETMAIAVEEKRARAMSKNYPEVLLRNGKAYTAVKIHKFDEESIRFTHSTGTVTAEAWLLPEAIQQDLDLGPNSIVAQLKELLSSLEDKSESETVLQPSSITPPPKGLTETEKQNLLVMTAELAGMEAKIRAAAANQSHFNQIAAQSASDASSALSRGVPSANFRIAAQNANASAAQCATFISNTEAECRKLRERIYILQSIAR